MLMDELLSKDVQFKLRHPQYSYHCLSPCLIGRERGWCLSYKTLWTMRTKSCSLWLKNWVEILKSTMEGRNTYVTYSDL
jgi:hypothetical protein